MVLVKWHVSALSNATIFLKCSLIWLVLRTFLSNLNRLHHFPTNNIVEFHIVPLCPENIYLWIMASNSNSISDAVEPHLFWQTKALQSDAANSFILRYLVLPLRKLSLPLLSLLCIVELKCLLHTAMAAFRHSSKYPRFHWANIYRKASAVVFKEREMFT